MSFVALPARQGRTALTRRVTGLQAVHAVPVLFTSAHLSSRDMLWNLPQVFSGWFSFLHATHTFSGLVVYATFVVDFGIDHTLCVTLSYNAVLVYPEIPVIPRTEAFSHICCYTRST